MAHLQHLYMALCLIVLEQLLKTIHFRILFCFLEAGMLVAGSRPDEVNEFLQFTYNPSSHARSWGLLSL
jgi:hypothetical protein